AADISPNDVILTRRYPSSNILDLRIVSTGDQVTLNLSTAFPAVDGTTTQGKILFADGTQWNLSWAPADPTVGSSGDDVLDGSFPGTFTGLGGDDTYLLGSSGVAGTYAVIETADGGVDTIQSLMDYTLDAEVENLILAESRSSVIPNPARGTGNELDNLIIG